jgi:CheY-like chemotaxis protein
LPGALVLVVDDDPDARDVLQYAVRDTGAMVEAVASATEALDLVARHSYDAVIADLSMPDMDGYVLVEALRHVAGVDGRPPCAIAVTAYAGDFHRRRALAAGYDAYLAKPVAPAELAHTLHTLLARRIDAGVGGAAV